MAPSLQDLGSKYLVDQEKKKNQPPQTTTKQTKPHKLLLESHHLCVTL